MKIYYNIDKWLIIERKCHVPNFFTNSTFERDKKTLL